jgi:hypothetical protein
MLSDANKPIMLSVFMLSVVILNVVAPKVCSIRGNCHIDCTCSLGSNSYKTAMTLFLVARVFALTNRQCKCILRRLCFPNKFRNSN